MESGSAQGNPARVDRRDFEDIQRQLVDTWREAGKAIEAERRRALVSRTPDDCRDEALDVLALGSVASARRQEQR